MINFDNRIDIAGKLVRKPKIQNTNNKKIAILNIEIEGSSQKSYHTVRISNNSAVDFIDQYLNEGDYIATTATMCGYFTKDNNYKFAILSDNIYAKRGLELNKNDVHLLGNIGTEIKTSKTKDGKTICSFYIYVKDRFNKDSDDYMFKINAFGKQAERLIESKAKKGDLLDINGYLKSNYVEKNNQRISYHEINANFITIAKRKEVQQKQNYNNIEIGSDRKRYDENSDLIYEQSKMNFTESSFKTDLPF